MWSPSTLPPDPLPPDPLPPVPDAIDEVARVLDPVLVPLGFAPGHGGASEREGQVIFCRGMIGSIDGACVDLVVELAPRPQWRITDVHYWGFPSDRWHLAFDVAGDLADQLADLARTLPLTLADP